MEFHFSVIETFNNGGRIIITQGTDDFISEMDIGSYDSRTAEEWAQLRDGNIDSLQLDSEDGVIRIGRANGAGYVVIAKHNNHALSRMVFPQEHITAIAQEGIEAIESSGN